MRRSSSRGNSRRSVHARSRLWKMLRASYDPCREGCSPSAAAVLPQFHVPTCRHFGLNFQKTARTHLVDKLGLELVQELQCGSHRDVSMRPCHMYYSQEQRHATCAMSMPAPQGTAGLRTTAPPHPPQLSSPAHMVQMRFYRGM